MRSIEHWLSSCSANDLFNEFYTNCHAIGGQNRPREQRGAIHFNATGIGSTHIKCLLDIISGISEIIVVISMIANSRDLSSEDRNHFI